MPNYHLFASLAKSSDNVLKRKAKSNKKKIELDLLYQRLGCQSIKILLLANQAELWKDSEIIISNDLISTSDHNIATIQKQKRNLFTEPNPDPRPSHILCLDIIKSPYKISIMQDTSFPYYLLIVDAYSRLPKLHASFSVSTKSVMSALQYVQTKLLHLTETTNVFMTNRIQ